MGTAYSARQSSYTQGDTINADDSNDEFDAILAAFGTSGHSHDGTAGEGGAIAKLLSNTLTFGAATSGTDITITFDGESNDGVLAWMEDEDYFKFSDDILINSTEKIMFGDSTSFIHQSSDGVLTIDGEATIDLNASTAVLVSNDLKLNSDAAVLGFGADNDVTLTHVADTGLLLNSTMAIQFNDASQYINAPSATVLDINATDEVEVNATLMDVNANLDVSGTSTFASDVTFTGASYNAVWDNSDNALEFADSARLVFGTGSDLTIYHDGSNSYITESGDETGSFYIKGTNLFLLDAAGEYKVGAVSGGAVTLYHDNSAAKLATTSTGVNVTGDVVATDDLYLDSDAAVIHLGDDGDVTLTHVADTGLLLNSTRQLQFGDSGTYIHQSADGVLDLVSDTEIEINATTIDINGAVDVSGAYTGGGLMTTGGNIVIPDAGNIGSASDTDAIAISSGGVVTFSQTPVFSSDLTLGDDLYLDSDGAVIHFGDDGDITLTHTADTGLTTNGTFQATTITATTAVVPDASDGAALGTTSLEWSDLYLADGAVIGFGDDQDVTLTHVADTGLLLNSTMALQFNDASQYINAPSATVLDINATDEVEVNATLMDVNANLDVSGTYTGGGLMTTGGNIVIPNAGNIGSASDTDAIAISSGGVVTMNQIPVFSAGINVSGGTIAGTLATAAQGNVTSLGTLTSLTVDNIIINGNTIGHTSDTDAITIASDGKVTLNQQFKVNGDVLADFGGNVHLTHDGAILHFGANSEITLTHVHDTGIQLPDNQKMLFGDNNDLQIYHNESHSFIDDAGTGDLYIRGDNSLYISNAAGTETKASFTSDGAVNLYYNNTAVAMTNGTAWTPSSADGSSLGNSSLEWSDLYLADSSTIQFGNDQDVILTHVPDSGIRLSDSDKMLFGDGDDLQIYHVADGNSWIRDTATAGNLIIEAVNGIDFRDYNTGELMTRMTGDGGVTLYHNNQAKFETNSDGVTLSDNQLIRANLKDYGEVTSALGSGGGSRTIDLEDGNNFTATVSTSTVTWTFSNPTASDELCGFTLFLTNGGSQTVNWPASVDWAGGTAPTLTTSGLDILVFVTTDGGTTWHGMVGSADSK